MINYLCIAAVSIVVVFMLFFTIAICIHAGRCDDYEEQIYKTRRS